MRGSLWQVALAGIGTMTLFLGAGQALPSSPASSTQSVEQVLSVTQPVIGQLLLIAAVSALLFYAFN
jgi:succinate dehydrogenase/fumarate reductase cytochrome b subunit